MDISSGSQYWTGENLLLTVVGTVLQMAKIARINEANEELKVFYSHLSLHCFRLQEQLTRAQQAFFPVNKQLVDHALGYIGTLIHEYDLNEHTRYTITPEFSLRTLCVAWDEASSRHDEEEQLAFVLSWLRPGLSEALRRDLDMALERCADELDKLQPKQPALRSVSKYTYPESTEPPYAVRKAAKSIFDALMGCKGCSCHTQYDYKAKLELGTYRSPTKKRATRPARRWARNGRGDDVNGDLELDMFVSMERDWHEVRVQTVKESVVRFEPLPAVTTSASSIIENCVKVEKLCRPIMKTRAMQRLVLKLNGGQLFEMGLEKSNFQINHSAEPISLLQCLEDRPEFFTEKTQRILLLIIGYTVLHLHGTSWLQPGWGSSNIKFFQTTSQKTPLRPFIETQLPKDQPSGQGNGAAVIGDHVDLDDDMSEELDSGHCCPEVVALAVVLMETRSGRITLMDVDQVFEGEEEGEEGWRSQIPEDSPLLVAIDNCLNPELWEDDDRQPLDSAMLRSRIYQKVVRPLEIHLTNGFSNIKLDGVDQYARNIDFGKWGKAMSNEGQKDWAAPLYQREVSSLQSSSHPKFTLVSPGQYAISVDGWKHMCPNPYSAWDTELLSVRDAEYRALQFFDDEVNDGEHSAVETKKYEIWKSEYCKVYEKFVASYLTGPSSQPVKVAILDTGVDRDHIAFEAREDNLKGKRNCYNDAQKNVPDANGHGTFTANLILDYSPDVSLYVIKIADRENARPEARIVANAINHAVDKWDVDIISMSFGWPSSDFDGHDIVEAAIDNAAAKKVLMFAAASNAGGRLGRAYPASSAQVICVHSTDTNGSASGFSPTAEPGAINIATVGESVQSAWPMLLCRDGAESSGRGGRRCTKTRSGTSYATPIIAGTAAFLLQYARLHLSEAEARALKRREKMEAVLRRCAVRGPGYQTRDGYYYIHLSLDKHNLFGGDLDWVSYEISKAMKS